MPAQQLHDDAVAVKVVGLGNWESAVVQRFHVCKLLHGCKSRQVEPRSALAVLVVVALVFDLAKRRATKSANNCQFVNVQKCSQLFSFIVFHL